MNILVVTNLYPPHYIGGYELICQTVVEALRERGHTIQILTSNHHVSAAAPLPNDSAIERVLQINGLYGHPWHGVRTLPRVEVHNNRCLRRAVERHRPDLVYVWNMGGLSKSMLLTLQQLGTPTVFYLSDHWIARSLAADIWLRWWNAQPASRTVRCARRAAGWTGLRAYCQRRAPTNPIRHLHFPRIYFCSRALRDLTAKAGYDVAHGAIIHCPVHLRYFQDPPIQPAELKRLLYVGRLAEDKGVMTALRALVLLREKLNCELNIYGRGDPEYVDQLQKFVHTHQLNAAFKSASLDEMPSVYRSHDLLLFTSEWAEPFALTPIEAMGCGLPVVGTTTGGSAELFRHGENALTYAAGQPSQLAARIEQFAADPQLRARCAQTAHCEALQRYAAPVIVDQIERYLKDTLQIWKPIPLPQYRT